VTAEEVDYCEVFIELSAADSKTAERLLDIATVIVAREREIMKRMQRGGWKTPDAELNRLLALQNRVCDEIKALHERLVGEEEKDEAHTTVRHTQVQAPVSQ
jgi:hypothetical protein